MKAKIDKIVFEKEYESKFGTLYLFSVHYNGKKGYYSSKKREQTKFREGEEAEFTEEIRNKGGNEYIIIKPVYTARQSNFGRALKKEQSRYTTMGASYVKDLIIAGKLDIKDWERATEKIVKFMFNLDKELEQ